MPNQGFQLDISTEHGNWLTIGELIRSVQKPTSVYVDEVVKAFHNKLCKDLLAFGKCTNPNNCNQNQPTDLCISCRHWLEELAKFHVKGDNPYWDKNCSSAKWSEDHWELAKFFMPTLGNNQSTVVDAQSTDLSGLLNVLEWMKETAFLEKTRVNVGLVRKLRSQVRNTWAHAPKHEITDDEKAESFSIASEFLQDLEKVFSKPENGECLEHLKELNDNGVTNVVASELHNLLLQRELLCDIKGEITGIKVEQSSDKSAIEEHGQKLDKLNCAMNECSQRMSDFQSLKDNINKQFDNFAEQLRSFSEIPNDIHEIRHSIGQIRDQLSMNNRRLVESEPTSCPPKKVPMFTAREDEIQKVISFLIEDKKAIVSLHGGPGFGKSAIAVEVSHKLNSDETISVVFSYLSTVRTISEMIVQLCRDVGVYNEDDPKSSFIFWLKNIKKKVVFVFDDIDNLLEEKEKTHLFEFLRLMQKNSNQHCQIVTTSRAFYTIPELSASVNVGEMDDISATELLKQRCPDQDGEFLKKLSQLCGHIPLAMCIAASRIVDFEDPNELLEYLEKQPMKTLKSPESDLFVHRAISMSYEKLDNETKQALVRLTVFEGTFSEAAAKAVIERENLDTKDILKYLVHRSLIKQPIQHRYSIPFLIRRFLIDQNEENKSRAETLMVGYYLDLGHELTIESYSKDGYKANREALKKEAHNIQNVLKICNQQKDINSDISTSLITRQIYTISARLFSIFVRTVIPGSIVDEFLQRCAKLAEGRKQRAIKISFDCLLADQERSKSIGKADEDFENKMEAIEKEFQMHRNDLEEDKSLYAHYLYQHGRYLSRKAEKCQGKERLSLLKNAHKQLENSLDFRKSLADTPVGKADYVFALLCLGNICKFIANCEHFLGKKNESEEFKKKSQFHYEKAKDLSKKYMGEHQLTSACYKSLGDLFFKQGEHDSAEENYNIAKEMREKLGLNTSETHVYLLHNLGKCLTHTKRKREAILVLESALNMAENLAESDVPNDCKAKVYSSLAIAYQLAHKEPQNAVKYAKKALEFKEIDNVIGKKDFAQLKKICRNGEST